MNPLAAKMRSDETFKISTVEIISNINYQTDINHMLRHTRCLLGLLGIWPMVSQNSTKMGKYVSKLMILVCFISPAFILIPLTHYMILREKNMIARLVLITPIGFTSANLVKYVFIGYRCEMIKRCIEHVKTDWMRIDSENERTTMKRNVKAGHNLTVICGIFMYTGGFFYNTIMPFRSGKTLNEFNETMAPLAFPGYDAFVDVQSSPTYEITFFIICWSGFVSYTVVTATCNLAAIFITHACGQVQIVISRLGNIVEENDQIENNEKTRERISSVIRCHVRALRLVSYIEVILREICLIEVVASTFTICLLEYYCMTALDSSNIMVLMTYFIALLSMSFNVFIFCHIGELLREQHHQVGVAAYMVEWYRLPGKTGLDLVMLIIMANYSRTMTAGGMIELNISSFGTIIKMSLSYFNMLRAMTE